MAAERSRRAKVVTRPRWVRRIIQVGAFIVILFVFFVAACLAVYFPIYRDAVANVQTIDSKLVVTSSTPSEILSADGHVLYSISLERRTVKNVDELPAYVRYAIVAAEDRRFYDHHGVDFIGLMRAGFVALRDRRASQGASTIEMQLAKKLVNGDEHSLTRKLKDAATAQQIENLKTKSEILNLYMNEVYFGEGAYGIEAAAETYFAKHAEDLTIAEAAMLARCVRSPSKDNPIRDLQGSIVRRDYVLAAMHEEHWITDQQYRSALKEVPKLNPNPPEGIVRIDPVAGYFVDHVLREFKTSFPDADLQTGGYRIVTNLNYRLQRDTVAAVRHVLQNPENRRRKVNNAAFVLINSDGRIEAEVGGPDYTKSKWNVISQDYRQPGSAFKAFLYAAALKDGVVHLGDYISNEPIVKRDPVTGAVWMPRNNGRDKVGGTMELTHAFALSYNLPAIHTIEAETPQSVAKYGHDIFGFESHLYAYDSLAIGTSEVSPLEMAAGYSVFMNNGDRVEPFPINKVVGPDGSVLKEYQPEKYTGVLDPSICQELDSMMEAVVQWGTGTAARDVPDARGKTGTTQDAKDAWFCGYSDGLLGIGWVGHTAWIHHKPHALPMASSVYGGTVTCGMWAEIMMAAHRLGLTKAPAPPPVVDRRVPQPVVAKVDRPKPDLSQQDPDTSAMPDPSQVTPPQSTDPNPPQGQPGTDQPGQAPNQPDQGPTAAKASAPPSTPQRSTSRRPAPKKQDDESDYVEVEVCADTGMRASIYCPETVMRRYKRGTEPKEICRLHTGG